MRGHIRKRPRKGRDGRPYEQYVIVYDRPRTVDPETGVSKRRSKWETVPPPNTRKHAEKLLAERLAQLHRGEYAELRPISFPAFAQKWMDTYARGQVRPATLSRYEGLLRNHLNPIFESRPLGEISIEDVQWLKSTKSAEGQSPQSVKHILRLLRQLFNHAIDWGYLTSNPAEKVAYPKIIQGERDCLTPGEVRLFLEHVPHQWKSFFITAITTGMRIGEMLAMKWQHIDWNSGQYRIREIYSRKRDNHPAGFAPPKTDGSAQNVDLTPTCMAALRVHQAAQAAQKLKNGPDYHDLDLVYCTASGAPLNDRNVVHRNLEPALKDAGLRRIRFHDLRHTCASLLIAQGESAKYVQRQMRHASVRTTFDLYGHLFPDANREAARRLDDQLFGPASQQTAG